MDPVEQIPGAPTFTLRAFVAEGAERLRMEVVVGGDGLEHEVLEPMCNRPGLALTDIKREQQHRNQAENNQRAHTR